MSNVPRLTVELVPRLAWGQNVRSVVARNTWDLLRWRLGAMQSWPRHLNVDVPNRSFFRDKLQCAYCKTEQKNTLDLHEEWHYDDEGRVQRLVGLKPICKNCHLAKHFGYASTTGRADEALAHLAVVNGWTLRQARAYTNRAFAIWETRSNITYALDVNDYLECFDIPPDKIHMDWLTNPRK